jgi:hypothetical protein
MGRDIHEGYARFPGVFKDGRVEMADGLSFPDGTEVEVVIIPIPFTPEEQAEFDAWDKLSDEAWAMIDELEKEDDRAPGRSVPNPLPEVERAGAVRGAAERDSSG